MRDALPIPMMRKLIPVTALVLGLSGGVALADRDHGRGDHGRGDNRSAHVERREAPRHFDHGHNNGGFVRDHRDHRGWDRGRVVVRNDHSYRHYDRRPIYVSRPVIRERYYNYYRRPSVIVENYNPMAGYYWVNGSWSWTGYEWVWQPGHYEPDSAYIGVSFNAGF